MSNKIVTTFDEPTIYRAVIDDVISAIKTEFDEFGVAEDVLAELQHKWENKVIASHVAEFEAPHQAPPQHHYPPHAHPMHMIHPHYAAAPYPGPPPQNGAQSHVKAEPVDPRYVLNGPSGVQYTLPPLPGPQMASAARPQQPPPPHVGGQTSVLSFPPGPPARPLTTPAPRAYMPPVVPASGSAAQSTQRIPQVDGPSDSDDDSPSPPSFAPRPSHPSLPQPQSQSQGSARAEDAEAINSDLDDSDTEGEEEAEDGGAAETDIVFCTYDKVARVKNKWKCVLKDGMIHVNGKDYLFAKCTGEFEW